MQGADERLASGAQAPHIKPMLKVLPIVLAVAYGMAMYHFSAWRTRRELDAQSTELADPMLKVMCDKLAKALDLPRIRVPMLFVQGTRDAFARRDLLQATLATLGARATLIEIEEGDHSFAVPKRLGRPAALVERAIFDGLGSWLDGLGL